MDTPILNYRGNAGVEDMSAFNARLHFTWKGDHLFRIYPADGNLYFIRVGASKSQNMAIGAQFGLLGALLIYLANKRQAKKTQQTLNQIAGAHPAELVGSHKLNFVLPLEQVREAEIVGKSFLVGSGAGRCRMVETSGKKRNLSFDDSDNMRLAIAQLSTALPERLKVSVQWDEGKGKFRKA